MLNTCAVHWQVFSNRWAMKIALGGHEIPSPEFIAGDCAILSTDKSAAVLLAPYIAIVYFSFITVLNIWWVSLSARILPFMSDR